MSAVSEVVEPRAAQSGHGFIRLPRTLRLLLRQPVAGVCLAYVAVVVGVAIVAPIVLPNVQTQHAGDLLHVLQGPSRSHPLGTDGLGRDVLDRLLVGTRVTIVGVLEALVVVLALGVPAGLAAGFLGSWVDRVIGWLADLTFSIPSTIVILVVLSVFPQSMLAGMLTFGVLGAPGLMRVVRSATLPVRHELYVSAARVSGLSKRRIIARHILPRITGPIIVQTSLLAAIALLVQTGFSFLNLIVAAPAPSWGGMVADGLTTLERQPWLIWPPGVTIAVTIVVLGLLADAIRDTSAEIWSAAPPRRRRRSPPRVVELPVAAPTASTAELANLLSIRNLVVEITKPGGAVTVLHDVDLDIGTGEVVGLVGESGSGKTMTAMAILGLLPSAASISSGEISFDGYRIADADERDLRRLRGRDIGFVSQEPMASLNPSLRIGVQLEECVRRHRRLSRRDARAHALELLDMVHLADPAGTARSYPYELSGGMAQRVSIARALAGEPRLLIADEPTTALDVTVQAEILSLLRELQRERHMGVLFVTHDWGLVAEICDRVVVMYAGEVVERASVEAIFDQPLHPYTRALMRSSPRGARDGRPLPAIPGSVPGLGEWPRGCHFHPRCELAEDVCRVGAVPTRTISESDRETRCLRYEKLLTL